MSAALWHILLNQFNFKRTKMCFFPHKSSISSKWYKTHWYWALWMKTSWWKCFCVCVCVSGLISSCCWSKSVDSLCISVLFSSRCKLRSIFCECAEVAVSLCTFSRFISSLYLSWEMFCWAHLLFSSFPLLSCLLCCIQRVSCIYLYIYSLMPFWPVNHVCPFHLPTSCLVSCLFIMDKVVFVWLNKVSLISMTVIVNVKLSGCGLPGGITSY